MTFTDDDLKRLKDTATRCEESASSLPLDEMIADVSPLELKALIARLEAAERLIECVTCGRDVRGIWETFYEKWRKAAGK